MVKASLEIINPSPPPLDSQDLAGDNCDEKVGMTKNRNKLPTLKL